MKYKDYYQTLGIDKKASQEQIKKAYRKLAVKYHPDKNQGDSAAEERFKEVNEAFEVLGNAEKRQKYDKLGANWQAYEQGGFDWSQYGGNPFGHSGTSFTFEGDPNTFFGGNSGFSDFFERFFAGQGTPFQTQSNRGRDTQAELPITLEEAYHGGAKVFDLNGQRIRIQIKAGAYDGQKLRLKGKGQPGPQGGENGDLIITLRQKTHPTFTRKGDDLYGEVSTDLYTAILGGKVAIPSLSGPVNITIPKGTNSGKTLRLRGKGMPVYGKNNQFGNLFVTIKVQLPQKLTPQEIKLFEQLRALRQPAYADN